MGFGFSQERVRRAEAVNYTDQRKQVFGSHSNLAHVWAQNSVRYGRASDGRMYFERGTIYSYGAHFPIATFTEHEYKGRRVVLFTTDKRSVSTSQHIGHARGALRGLPHLIVPVEGLADLRIGTADDAAERSFDWLVTLIAAHDTQEARDAANAFRQLFKLKRRIPDDPRAWLEARESAAAAKRDAHKLEDAKAYIKRFVWPTFETDFGTNTYRADDSVRRCKVYLKQLRGARLTVGKRKFANLVALARKHIKHGETLLPTLEAAARDAHRAAYRGVLLKQLDDIASGKETWGFIDRLSSAKQLHALALELGRIEDAQKVLNLVHIVQLREETVWRAPRESELRYSYRRSQGRQITIEDWQNGMGEASFYDTRETLVRRKGDRLQTSRGAEAPWKLCVLAFVIAQECRRTGTDWIKNGKRLNLGHYELDRVDANGTLHAGCHTIGFEEMQRLAIRETPHTVAPRYPLPVVI
jgi:hypothetical protein